MTKNATPSFVDDLEACTAEAEAALDARIDEAMDALLQQLKEQCLEKAAKLEASVQFTVRFYYLHRRVSSDVIVDRVKERFPHQVLGLGLRLSNLRVAYNLLRSCEQIYVTGTASWPSQASSGRPRAGSESGRSTGSPVEGETRNEARAGARASADRDSPTGARSAVDVAVLRTEIERVVAHAVHMHEEGGEADARRIINAFRKKWHPDRTEYTYRALVSEVLKIFNEAVSDVGL